MGRREPPVVTTNVNDDDPKPTTTTATTTATVSIASSPAPGAEGGKVIARRTSEGSVSGGGGGAATSKDAAEGSFLGPSGEESSGEEREKDVATGLMASLVLEDVVPAARVVLPRLELSLCGGDLAEFDEHAVESALFAADPEGITSHPKLAVRPWRPPGMETAPPPRGRRRCPTSWGTWHSGRRCRRATSRAYPRARGHLPRTRRRRGRCERRG